MAALDSKSRFISENPVVYRIAVMGRLSPSLSGRLANMRIEPGPRERGDDERSCITTLMGPLADQSQLSGVLNALFERRLTILTVEALSEDSSMDSQNKRVGVHE